MVQHFLFLLTLGLCLSSCKPKNILADYDIQDLPDGDIIFSTNKQYYFYDLKVTKDFYTFYDDQSDTVAWIVKKELPQKPIAHIKREFSQQGLQKPCVTKDVSESLYDANIITLIDDNLYHKQIQLDPENNTSSILRLPFNFLRNKFDSDFNLIRNKLCAIPIHKQNKSPFYIFTSDSGFFWIDPPLQIEKILPNDATAYTTTICSNEKQKSIVAAYRFTNQIAFYGIDGELRQTIQLGEKSILPVNKSGEGNIDIEKSIKCFTYICGTPQYVYCLYDGSSDFTSPSQIAVFQWNGKLVKVWQADRNFRAIAVDKDDKHLLAISTNTEGQDIIKYEF